jgi:hypothetical protein
MFNNPPPDPPPDRRDEPNDLKFDDFIGILVAFASIGTILWWSLSQIGRDSFAGFLNIPFNSSGQTSKVFVPPAKDNPRVIVTPVPNASPSEADIAVETPVTPRTTQVIPVPIPSPVKPVEPKTQVVPVPTQTSSPVVTPAGFADVPPDYWAEPFIKVVVRRGILQGFPDGTFKPEQVVTRSEFAKLVRDAFNTSKTRGALEFKDIPAGDERTEAIDEAVETEFMKGYPGQVFRPGEPIKRVEALVALTNGLKLPASTDTDSLASLYKDSQEIPRYAKKTIASASKGGLVANYPEVAILAPNRDLTRAEAAVFIHQALASLGQVDKISSPYLVPSP